MSGPVSPPLAPSRPMPREKPLPKNKKEVEEYEQPVDPTKDGLIAQGFYPQNATPYDAGVGITRDALGNLILLDKVMGRQTLASLLKTPDTQVSYVDFLLDNEPDQKNNLYALTRVGGKVSRETWMDSTTLRLLKTIDYIRSGGKVIQEVRRVFADDGVIVVGILTVSYERDRSGHLTDGIYTRNV